MLDHFRGSGVSKADWVATIRNGIRNGWALRDQEKGKEDAAIMARLEAKQPG